jgi:hypothetical protein
MYGCETWFMIENGKCISNMWKIKNLYEVYGPVTEQVIWRTKTYQEVRKLYKHLILKQIVK